MLAAVQVKRQVDHGTAWGAPEFKAAYETIYPPAATLIEVDPESGALPKTTVSFLLTLRAGHGGTTLVAVRPTIAAFIQPDTRPVQLPDGTFGVQPQLHGHLVIPNCVTCPDGKVRSFDGAQIYRGAKSWGAVQHAAFVTELQKLGYAIGDVGETGTFEIVPPETERETDRALRTFRSQRRAAIVAKLGEAGLTMAAAPAVAAKAAVATRRGKVAETSDVFERWPAEAAAHGVDVANFIKSRQNGVELSSERRESLIAERVGSVPTRLTEREATFGAGRRACPRRGPAGSRNVRRRRRHPRDGWP